MNKLIVPLTVISVLGLFNAYSSLAQSGTGQRANQTENQARKPIKDCGIAGKETCCKSEKAKPGHCCACCTGSTCAASSSSHCCG